MPLYRGFVKRLKRDRPSRPTDPDWGIDEGVDPDYGIDAGGDIDNELPEPPPGVWPPLTPEHPVQPLPPTLPIPPGSIWPPVNAQGKHLCLVWISGVGYRYTVIDVGQKWPGSPEHPIAPGEPGAQPKR